MKKAFFLIFLCLLVLASCSINKMAINAVSNALTGSGSSEVFTGDSDPILVGDALPFAIKMYEALLSQNPKHQGLLLTTGSLFVMYANAFVQGPAEMLPFYQYEEKQTGLIRAKKLYLRGAEILYSGLDLKYPGFSGSFKEGTLDTYLSKTKKDDVPLLYWAVAGVLSAYSLDSFNMELGVRVPELKAMIERAYKMDPDFNDGAIDEFYVLFYASVPEALGGDKVLADVHFKKALEKSQGFSAGPYVSYAQAICVPAQDYETFKTMLETALTVDPDKDPSKRLVNILSLKKAQYLLDNAGLYFMDLDNGDWDEWVDWANDF